MISYLLKGWNDNDYSELVPPLTLSEVLVPRFYVTFDGCIVSDIELNITTAFNYGETTFKLVVIGPHGQRCSRPMEGCTMEDMVTRLTADDTVVCYKDGPTTMIKFGDMCRLHNRKSSGALSNTAIDELVCLGVNLKSVCDKLLDALVETHKPPTISLPIFGCIKEAIEEVSGED